MQRKSLFHVPGLLTIALSIATAAALPGAHKSFGDQLPCDTGSPGQCGNRAETVPDFDPLVAGNNSCYMAKAWFPRAALEVILPEQLSIPDNNTMTRHYPETELDAEAHPFMLSVCHGAKIHDVYTGMNVPEQEEIMFVFPVVYTHEDGTAHLASYVPVLYLDSLTGVLGGLWFGLRKEYHPGMKHGEDTAMSRWWSVEDIIEASFETHPGENMEQLPPFFAQTFENPFVTVSYPLPFSKTVFYQASVSPSAVHGAGVTFYWRYEGVTIRDREKTPAVQADYSFTLSAPMDSQALFGEK